MNMKNLLKYKFINKLCIRVVNITIPAKDVRKKNKTTTPMYKIGRF